MADLPRAGPPKFAPLKRTVVRLDSKIAPDDASLTGDFSKTVPMLFTGAPPAQLPTVATDAVRGERLGRLALDEEALQGPKPAAAPQSTVANPDEQVQAETAAAMAAAVEGAVAAEAPPKAKGRVATKKVQLGVAFGSPAAATNPGMVEMPAAVKEAAAATAAGKDVPISSVAVHQALAGVPQGTALGAAVAAAARAAAAVQKKPSMTAAPAAAAALAPVDETLDDADVRQALAGVQGTALAKAAQAANLAKKKPSLTVGPKAAVTAAVAAVAPRAAKDAEGVFVPPVPLGKVRDEAHAKEIEPVLLDLMEHVTAATQAPLNPPKISPTEFVPDNRRAFKHFVIQTFKKYKLPPQSADPDPDTCEKAAKASSKELKTFQYQAFVRDYLQRASPYRGLLVYHGLGSGKTCTSIATAEALYGAGNRKIFIMTPASLSGNFRGEMSKCGYFAFQQENFWTHVEATPKMENPQFIFLKDVLGLPIDWIKKNKGGWVPDPTLPSNWHTLSAVDQATINEQIQRHIASRFTFINYNGLTEKKVRDWACKEEYKHMFDGAVIVIDEIHNLIRTINNSNLETFYKQEPLQPEYDAKFCMTGKKYRISYLVYRLLCNAVGTKIIGLSGTPIINYPQELGILANLMGGDMRYISATLNPKAKLDVVKTYLARHPEVDLYDVISSDGAVSIRLTPVPSGYRKVIDATTNEIRGLIRDEDGAASEGEIRRERDLNAWMTRVEDGLQKIVKTTGALFGNIVPGVNQRLPDYEKPFVDMFINKESLTLNKPNDLVLMARLSGLISYYKAGKPELVARVEKDEVVEVEMSARQLQQYTIVRNTEIKQEDKDRKTKKKAPVAAKAKKAAAAARYEEVIKSQKGTFKIFSRASCNFVFPDDIPRPRPGDDHLVGKYDLGQAKSDDSQGDILAEAEQDEDAGAAAVAAKPEPKGAAAAADPYLEAIRTALASLRRKGAAVFAPESLPLLSPKFQALIDRLETAKGPALVYSQFKTLEGLGILGMALEFQKNYIKFDVIPQANGLWTLDPALLTPENKNKKRYIMYTGDENAQKRDILKHVFNANWAKIPAALGQAIKELAGAQDNIKGKIAQVFMITQSGAEGISLSNVRQVHLMEPYWNYVRLEQVKGRAIRICSHKDLPFAERTVEVFTYISKFSEQHKRERQVDETLMIKDSGLTTDQSIFSISQDKRKLADSLFDAMKQAAVDCELNATENGTAACYRFPTPSMQPLFHPEIEQDIRESAAKTKRK
jgi:hypothetical protein